MKRYPRQGDVDLVAQIGVALTRSHRRGLKGAFERLGKDPSSYYKWVKGKQSPRLDQLLPLLNAAGYRLTITEATAEDLREK